MRVFAIAALAASAYAIKQEATRQHHATEEGKHHDGEDLMRRGRRILEAIDWDQSGEIDSEEAWFAGVKLLEEGIISETDLALLEDHWPEEPVPIDEAAMALGEHLENDPEAAERAIRDIEDMMLREVGASIFEEVDQDGSGEICEHEMAEVMAWLE